MLSAIGELATTQKLGTSTPKVAKNDIWFLKYANTHPDTKIRYHASGMILHVESNASYFSISTARSRVGGYHYLSSPSNNPNLPPTETPPMNRPLHAVCKIVRNFMALSSEAEVVRLFLNE